MYTCRIENMSLNTSDTCQIIKNLFIYNRGFSYPLFRSVVSYIYDIGPSRRILYIALFRFSVPTAYRTNVRDIGFYTNIIYVYQYINLQVNLSMKMMQVVMIHLEKCALFICFYRNSTYMYTLMHHRTCQ